MLSQLTVKNLAVVEFLDLDFATGMSVITGETGAGKSVLMQALSFALGARADSAYVRHGSKKAEVSATFNLPTGGPIEKLLKDNGLDDDGECILRRVLTVDGRSKAFINGASVTLSTMRMIGERLIDMHGQNEHQQLLKNEQQRNILDGFAKTAELIKQVNHIVSEYNNVDEKIRQLKSAQTQILEQQELLAHQVEEMHQAKLEHDELNSIESDFKQSANAAELIDKVSQTLQQLNTEHGINQQMLALLQNLQSAEQLDPKLTGALELLTSSQVQVQEGVYELTHYLNTLDIDEARAQQLESRLSELHDLARKHQCNIPELLQVQERLEDKVASISEGANNLEALLSTKSKLEQSYKQVASQLSEKRKIKAREFSKQVTKVMQSLGMPGGEFRIELRKKDKMVSLNGNESVEYLVRINPGEEFRPLKKSASGGELSRISLAVSVVGCDSKYAPTLVFDEVDVGISGAVAEVVGQKLKNLSSHFQVLCITHLAQVAAFGQQHLKVVKDLKKQSTQTKVVALASKERMLEVARILSGKELTEQSIKAAEKMIANSA